LNRSAREVKCKRALGNHEDRILRCIRCVVRWHIVQTQILLVQADPLNITVHLSNPFPSCIVNFHTHLLFPCFCFGHLMFSVFQNGLNLKCPVSLQQYPTDIQFLYMVAALPQAYISSTVFFSLNNIK